MADWVQQDGEWDCCNCGVVFPDGKPVGHDFDPAEVDQIPDELSPFWQERKCCECCWGAWEEGFSEAVRLRHNEDLQQEMRAPAAAKQQHQQQHQQKHQQRHLPCLLWRLCQSK